VSIGQWLCRIAGLAGLGFTLYLWGRGQPSVVLAIVGGASVAVFLAGGLSRS
jgi:hypothetical protein